LVWISPNLNRREPGCSQAVLTACGGYSWLNHPMKRRGTLLVGLTSWLALPSQGQTLAEVRLPVRILQDRTTTLYVLDIQIEGKNTSLILATGSAQSWLDPSQGHPALVNRQGPTSRLSYTDGGQVQGAVVDLALTLGDWQRKVPLLLASSLEGPAPSVVETVKRYLAQGVLGLRPGMFPGIKRVSLSLVGSRPALILNPLIYSSAIALPTVGQTILLGKAPTYRTQLDSGTPFIWLRSTTAEGLGVRPEDLDPAPGSPPQVKRVNRLLKIRLGKLYLRFNPPQVLVVETDLLGEMDMVLGLPFFEQTTVTWDFQGEQVYVGEVP